MSNKKQMNYSKNIEEIQQMYSEAGFKALALGCLNGKRNNYIAVMSLETLDVYSGTKKQHKEAIKGFLDQTSIRLNEFKLTYISAKYGMLSGNLKYKLRYYGDHSFYDNRFIIWNEDFGFKFIDSFNTAITIFINDRSLYSLPYAINKLNKNIGLTVATLRYAINNNMISRKDFEQALLFTEASLEKILDFIKDSLSEEEKTEIQKELVHYE